MKGNNADSLFEDLEDRRLRTYSNIGFLLLDFYSNPHPLARLNIGYIFSVSLASLYGSYKHLDIVSSRKNNSDLNDLCSDIRNTLKRDVINQIALN